jgi:SAM-dependent methyltransferase
MEPEKWDWLGRHLRCPSCAIAPLALAPHGSTCAGCGASFGVRSRALDFLDLRTADAYHVNETENVSDHPFDGNAMSIIQQVGEAGGMVLDCGSGLKTVSFPHVVQVEIVDYPLVDVLAVNQRLPFVDGCFDAVLSLDVREHRDQPLVSAAEIARVLKPGGSLYIDLPFLQPEHGYPHHYFNATRAGLRQLFAEQLDIVSHHVPASGQPMVLLHWALNEYRVGLPDEERAQFDRLTVAELASRPVADWLSDPMVTKLSDERRWMLACTTQALLRKPRAGAEPDRTPLTAASLPGFPEAAKPDPSGPTPEGSRSDRRADDASG